MKKKSHLSLARFLIDNMQNEELKKYRKSFLIGSIWPDCIPSFLTKRHTIDETFGLLKKEIKKITENYDANKGITGSYCRRLGIITHYIADYFTYPHNACFAGSMKEHILYEIELMDFLKKFLNNSPIDRIRKHNNNFHTIEKISEFIKEMHEEYLNGLKQIAIDCKYIVELCVHVVKAILQILEINILTETQHQVKIA